MLPRISRTRRRGRRSRLSCCARSPDQHRPVVTAAGVARRPWPSARRALGGSGSQQSPYPSSVPAARTCRTGRSRSRCGVTRMTSSTTGSDAAHVGVVRRQDAEPGQLEEAGVDDLALVDVDAAVAEVVALGVVRITVARQPDEVPRRVRPRRRDRPLLDAAREVVGGREVDASRRVRRRCASAMTPAATRPAISAAIVDGEKPLCSSQRSLPNDGPCDTTKSAAFLMRGHSAASRSRPACSAIRIGYDVSSS